MGLKFGLPPGSVSQVQIRDGRERKLAIASRRNVQVCKMETTLALLLRKENMVISSSFKLLDKLLLHPAFPTKTTGLVGLKDEQKHRKRFLRAVQKFREMIF